MDSLSLEGAVSHRVSGHEHWMLKMNDLKVGSKSINPNVQFALTDTGTSLIYLDKLDYEAIIHTICKGLACFETEHEKNVFAIRNCEPSEVPTIWVQLDLHEYKLAPQAYVVSLVYPDGSHDCIIQFRQNRKEEGFIVLGNLFLMNYFQVYDVTLNQLSLTPLNKESSFVG